MRDITGLKVGSLTIISDTGSSQVKCRCDCGREQLFPRAITKPSYRGRKMCDYCRGSDCVICGKRIPQTTGRVAVTCCKEHARQYASEKEKARYQKIKDTDHFKETRKKYLDKQKERFKNEPGYYMALRARQAMYLKWYRQIMPPAQRKEYLAKNRENRNRWIEQLRSDPARYEEFKKKQRDWYQSLTDEEYFNFYGRKRTQIRKRK